MVQIFSEAQGALMSGSMAYYTFLSVLPLLMCSSVVIATLAHFDLDVRQAVVEAAGTAFPSSNGGEVLDQLIDARLTVGLVGVATLAYAGDRVSPIARTYRHGASPRGFVRGAQNAHA